MMGAVGLDVATGFITDQPNSEIIVTTSVMSGARYVTRLRDIYYISDNNVGQYIAKRRPHRAGDHPYHGGGRLHFGDPVPMMCHRSTCIYKVGRS
jgi:hypothetical protein